MSRMRNDIIYMFCLIGNGNFNYVSCAIVVEKNKQRKFTLHGDVLMVHLHKLINFTIIVFEHNTLVSKFGRRIDLLIFE